MRCFGHPRLSPQHPFLVELATRRGPCITLILLGRKGQAVLRWQTLWLIYAHLDAYIYIYPCWNNPCRGPETLIKTKLQTGNVFFRVYCKMNLEVCILQEANFEYVLVTDRPGRSILQFLCLFFSHLKYPYYKGIGLDRISRNLAYPFYWIEPGSPLYSRW